MKKFFILLFTVLLVVLLSGLLNTDNSNFKTVKFASWGSESEVNIIKSLIKEFENQNPEIKIEFVHVPQNYFQKLHLLFASNLAPDVVFLNNYYVPKYVKAGLLEDLTPYIKEKDFFEIAIKSFTFDNKIYAIPRDVSELVVYYNKDLFKKNNIPYPSENWTIEEYKNIAKKLTKDINNDGTNDIFGTGFETDSLFWLPFLLSNGASILSENGKELLIDKDNALKTLNDYSDMANKYNIAPQKHQSAGLTMAQMFLQQKIAMHISGRWVVPKYREQAAFDWDIAKFPSGSTGSIMNIDSSGYAVAKSSNNKKEAMKFIEFMTSKSSMDKLTQSGLIVPALKETAYSDTFLSANQKPTGSLVYLKTIETGKATAVNENYQKLTDELNQKLEPLFLGKKKAEDLFQ